MMKKKQLITFGIIIFASMVAALLYLFNPIGHISGMVVKVVDMPNMAEDGYYGIEVKDSAGATHSINATGYLNTPIEPAENNQTCLSIPKVKAGQKVAFNLPKDSNGRFETCFPSIQHGYFFRIE